jgi:hypothetical protein
MGREQSASQPGHRVMRGVIHLESYADPLSKSTVAGHSPTPAPLEQQGRST